MCSICRQFLVDYVQTGVPKEIPMSCFLKQKNLQTALPELVRWHLSLSEKIPQRDFDEAVETASRIARRGRGTVEYELLINTSVFNLLRYKFPWMTQDLDHLKVLLVEAGVVQKRKDWRWCLTIIQGYLAYTTPRTLLLLQEIHRDHSKAKGFKEDLVAVWKADDEASCADTDDYQKEILNDPTYGDWYD